VRVEAFVEDRSLPTSPEKAASREGERRSPTANSARTTPIRRSVDVIPSPDPSDGNQQYAAAAAAAAMALAANQNHHTARRGHASRRSSPRASPRASPRVSSNFSSPKSVETRLAARLIATDATVDAQKAEGALPAFALAFDDDGSRLAGYRDAKSASRVRVWHVAPSSLFSRPSAFANLTSFGARVSGAVAGAAGASGIGGVGIPIPSAGFVSVGCAESFPCGDTAGDGRRVVRYGRERQRRVPKSRVERAFTNDRSSQKLAVRLARVARRLRRRAAPRERGSRVRGEEGVMPSWRLFVSRERSTRGDRRRYAYCRAS
jgi:hypothetical protein